MSNLNKKKRYNWKSRQVVQTDVDDTLSRKIKVEASVFEKGRYDESNALVLPSEKRKSKKKKEGPQLVTKILSKKERKRLEKIVDTKKKKENRASLLEALSKVQVAPEITSQLTSIATVQTRGLKRHRSQMQMEDVLAEVAQMPEVQSQLPRRISSISGSKRLRKKLMAAPNFLTEKSKVSNLNVVGFDEESDSDTEDSDTDDEKEDLTKEEEDEVFKADPGNPSSEQVEKNDPSLSPVEKPIPPPPTAPLSTSTSPAVFVPVNRSKSMQEARMKLPILAEEQAIMEAVRENSVVVLAGETGSGKTTQVPQFLYEAGYASDGKLIGITEPRRVAAISMSQRVAEEMNLSSNVVSYLIRFEGNAGPQTKIKFMTDGVLLREVQTDFLLENYSVIIIDEAHERSVFTDILIGLLSRIVPLRNKRNNPLKLIIMSATLRLEDFTHNTRLFKVPPPVISVDSRQFPVTVHFNRRTAADYVSEAYRKVCKIHTQLPDGGILIFLTGQQEVKSIVKRLRKSFPYVAQQVKCKNEDDKSKEGEDEEEELLSRAKHGKRKKYAAALKLPSINLDSYPLTQVDDIEGDLLDSELSSDEDDEEGSAAVGSCQPMWVLPMYSLLPSNKQALVFQTPPPGTRLCVVSTNVAETSLTIPGVKYVVDCGRAKSKLYDKVTGVTAFHVTWTSKASANQRAGRAGRVAPGHCYRLYSSAMFNDQMPEFAEPDIQRRPVDDLIIQMKAMNIHKVVNFPFPSAPDLLQLRAAERRLTLLGALEQPKEQIKGLEEQFTGKLTQLGRAIAAYPLSPRYGKMLALSSQHDGLLPYTVCLVAALSVQEVLTDPSKANKTGWAGFGHMRLLGDLSVLLRAVGMAEYTAATQQSNLDALSDFCEKHGLRHKAIIEIRKLRVQLTNEVNLGHPEINLCIDPKMPPPTETQARLLRQIVLSGMVDQVAVRVGEEEVKDSEEKLKWRNSYRCSDIEEPVFMQSSCVLRKSKPEWVVYQEIYETSKMYMRGVTAIEPEWLPVYSATQCTLSPPMPEPPPRYDAASQKIFCTVSGSFGRGGWQLPVMEIEFPLGLERYKFFAQFLLEGLVFPQLQKYCSILLSTPATMTKNWSKLIPRTATLLKTLTAKEADSKKKIKKIWRTDSQYLLHAYQQWLPESAHNEVALLWPPV